MAIIYNYINVRIKAVLLLSSLDIQSVYQIFFKNQIQSEHLFIKMFILQECEKPHGASGSCRYFPEPPASSQTHQNSVEIVLVLLEETTCPRR